MKMTSYIIKTVWFYLSMSMIAANAGATIITKTHITTTKVALIAQLDNLPLRLASSDPNKINPNANSVDDCTTGIGADKRQASKTTVASNIYASNGTFTNGITTSFGQDVVGLSTSATTSNETTLTKDDQHWLDPTVIYDEPGRHHE